MLSRRAFLGWVGLVGIGILAHHKPGHHRGPATTTTLPPVTTTVAPTTTTTPGSTTTGPAGYADVYSDSYAGA